MALDVKPDLSFLSNRGGIFNNGWLCWPGATVSCGGVCGEFLDGDHLLAAGARTTGAEAPTGPRAVRAPLLGQVAGVAFWAEVEGAFQP